MSDRHGQPVSPEDGLAQQSTREARLVAAMEEFCAVVDAGQSVDRQALLRRYSDVADDLADCLAGMEIIHGAAEQVVALPDERSASEPDHTLQTLGDFHVLREIGRGGMGAVYEAEQQLLGRRVALKVLPFAAMMDERQRTRFQNEARAAATLNHPNIVPVYSVGVERGVHYYAMQYVEGQSLAELLQAMRQEDRSSDSADDPSETINSKTKPDVQAHISTERSERRGGYYRTIARLAIQIAEALNHAHKRGIIHRDIKPANILVDAHGSAMITDFGLARLDGDTELTLSGDMVGTFRYAPPEQVLGKRNVVDERADVYSLGLTVYELLSLRPAFDGDDRESLLRQITFGEPPRLRSIENSIPLDLETIVNKSIEKDPDDRYRSAGELAEDLQRFLDHQPLHARRPPLWRRLLKWIRRHRRVVAAVAVTLALSMIAASILLVRSYRETVAQRDRAHARQVQATENLELAMNAVDQMFSEFGDRWIADNEGLTLSQRNFLRRALEVYQSVAIQPADDARSRSIQARAQGGMATVHRSLGHQPEADEALRRQIALLEELQAESPSVRETHHDLASAHGNLGLVKMQAQDLDGALAEFDMAVKTFLSLQSWEEFELNDSLNFARANQNRADVLLRQTSSIEAAVAARKAIALWSDVQQRRPTKLAPALGRSASECILSAALLQQNRSAEALPVAEEALKRCVRWRLSFHDDRDTVRAECTAAETLALACTVSGDLPRAAELYERSLNGRVQLFRARLKPAQFSLAFVHERRLQERFYDQPSAFCDYVNVQLRCADVTWRLGRVHQTELLLGEAIKYGQILSQGWRDQPRYRVVWADGYAQLALLLADLRPAEAARALQSAAAIWRTALSEFPSVASYVSNVHGTHPDREWFQQTFPDEDVTQAPELATVKLGPDSVLDNHTTGVMYYEAGMWQPAIGKFEASLKLRQQDHVYDWLYLAMAHACNADTEQARTWLEKADEWIRQQDVVRDEALTLRRDCQEIIDG